MNKTCWKNWVKLINDIILWTHQCWPSAKPYVHQLCVDTWYYVECLPRVMNGRDWWWKRIKGICAVSATWWWNIIYKLIQLRLPTNLYDLLWITIRGLSCSSCLPPTVNLVPSCVTNNKEVNHRVSCIRYKKCSHMIFWKGLVR